MRRFYLPQAFLYACASTVLLASAAGAENLGSPERGRDVMIHKPLNPGIWSVKAYDELWKQWGVRSKPAAWDYARAVNERYGLHTAPFDNSGRPMGLIESSRLLGRGIVNNCLLCHAGDRKSVV